MSEGRGKLPSSLDIRVVMANLKSSLKLGRIYAHTLTSSLRVVPNFFDETIDTVA